MGEKTDFAMVRLGCGSEIGFLSSIPRGAVLDLLSQQNLVQLHLFYILI